MSLPAFPHLHPLPSSLLPLARPQAYNCMPYLFPATSPVAPGLAGLNLSKLGIPSLGEYARAYARNAGLLGKLDHFNYYMGLSLFRIAAIAQGVYARSMQGNASNASAASFGKVAVDVRSGDRAVPI